MIETLRIENIAVVEETELEFGPGLNVITGETGAGKSVILGALTLLAGGRASADSVRDGAEKGSVEAAFRTELLPDLEAGLAALGLVVEATPDRAGGRELVVARSITRGGRSRVRVAGELVPVATLADLFGGRIEISSQHSSQSLLRPESHGRFLDAAGGLEVARKRVADGYASLRSLDDELAALRESADGRERRRDFLAFQLAEIDAVGLEDGEIERLDGEHARLAHAERLRSEGAAALAALSGDPDRGAMDGGSVDGAADLAARALRSVEGLEAVDPSLKALRERLASATAELGDAARDFERYLDGIDVDPARLSRLDERLAQVEQLRRKYGGTEAEILAFRAETAAAHAALEGADARIESLEVARIQAALVLTTAAKKLSRGRTKAGRELAKRVETGLAELAMAGARFEVALEPAPAPEGFPCGAGGAESPAFLLAPNPGDPARSLQRVASGGELSRVFLALKNALRATGGMVVLVFDEVDAGIGGRAAERVGRSLAELAEHNQVLCITHLPQIAAFADVHFCVEKRVEKRGKGQRARASARGDRAVVRVERVSGEARVAEIARMAGGESVTAETLAHAEALLRAHARDDSRPPR